MYCFLTTWGALWSLSTTKAYYYPVSDLLGVWVSHAALMG